MNEKHRPIMQKAWDAHSRASEKMVEAAGKVDELSRLTELYEELEGRRPDFSIKIGRAEYEIPRGFESFSFIQNRLLEAIEHQIKEIGEEIE